MVLTSAPAYVSTSEVLKVVDPLDLTPLRFLTAAAILGFHFALTRRQLVLRWSNAPKVFATVALGYGVYVSLLNLGQRTVPAGTTSLLLNISPIFAFALAYVFLGERSTRKGLAGMGLATVGTVAVTIFGSATVGFDANALLVLAAALALGLFLNLQQPLLATVPAAEMVFWGCLVSGVLTLPFARFDLKPDMWRPSTHFAFAALVILSTVLACVFWNRSLAATSVASGGALLFAIPVFSVLLGWLLQGQIPSVSALVGGGVALCGVVLLGKAQLGAPGARPQGRFSRPPAPAQPQLE